MMLISMMRNVIYNKNTFEKNNNTEILKTQLMVKFYQIKKYLQM